jgi:hypothetical protein
MRTFYRVHLACWVVAERLNHAPTLICKTLPLVGEAKGMEGESNKSRQHKDNPFEIGGIWELELLNPTGDLYVYVQMAISPDVNALVL